LFLLRCLLQGDGIRRGADNMLKYDATGAMVPKIMGGVSLLIGSIAALMLALAEAGLIAK